MIWHSLKKKNTNNSTFLQSELNEYEVVQYVSNLQFYIICCVKFVEQRGDSVRHETKMQLSLEKSLSNTAVTFILCKEVLTAFSIV